MTAQQDGGLGDDDARIAVIGMACRFPGAKDPEEFWANLAGGVDSVTRFPPRPVRGGKGEYVPAGGFLDEPEWFDAGYFGYSPREARIIDPQHRVFLECATEALEDAGCDPERFPGPIGVYAGGTDTRYAAVLKERQASLPSVTDWEIRLATGADFLTSRTAYKLGLRGPAVSVRSACSTALVAVHLAVQSLLSGDCDAALAGGATVHVPALPGEYTEGGIVSPDGLCRSFDAAAQGTVPGNGAGVVVLRRLADALADGDPVRAVILGSAVTNDGPDRIGYTAPGVAGQAAAVRAAHLVAGVEPASIGYVETHGTATPIGDPIEIAALTEAFGPRPGPPGHCAIGTVKTNIGHTDAAAGAAGLIKTVLALEHGLIPPTLHFAEPNPEIDFASGPFRVATRPTGWRDGAVRRAGVSSFGMGGTNAHAVLDGPPAPGPPAPARNRQLLPLSARTPSALDAATARLAAHLRAHPEQPLADVAWTLQTGRRRHPLRRYAVADGRDDVLRVLDGTDPPRLVTSTSPPRERPVTLHFPGTTAYALRTGPAFSRRVAEAHGGLRPGSEPGLLAFAQEHALARLWSDWGVRPAAVSGTGTGALAAAAVAGVFALGDAARLAAELTRLLADGPPGPAAAARFEDRVRAVPRAPASMPIALAAGRRGGWVTGDEAADPALWAAHLLDARPHLPEAGPDTAGPDAGEPHALLLVAGGAKDVPAPSGAPGGPVIASITGDAADPVEDAALPAAGRLWLAGTPIAWDAVHEGAPRRRVPLPTYPFERRRHVVEPAASPPAGPAALAAAEPRPGGEAEEEGVAGAVERLFAEILGLDELDPDDSFFDLGGDSLIATQFLLRINRIYPVDLVLRSMFEEPTAAGFAELVERRLAGRERAEPEQVEPGRAEPGRAVLPGASAGGHDDGAG